MPPSQRNLTIKIPSDYNGLLRRVKETLIEGQRRIESQRVRTYWETGNLIYTHTLHHKDRADYGRQVLDRLADDMDVHVRRGSTKSYPTLFDTVAKLRWPDLPNSIRSIRASWPYCRHTGSIIGKRRSDRNRLPNLKDA